MTINGPTRDWADWGTWAFNGLLFVVGALQVVLLCWTLRVIRRQAKEMIRQRILMRKQWAEMSQQTISLKEYVEATKEAVKAAQVSAQAAKDNVELIIDKDRARIQVRPTGLVITSRGSLEIDNDKVIFEWYNFGATQAFPLKSCGKVAIADFDSTPTDGFDSMPSLPPVIVPNYDGTEGTAPLPTSFDDKQAEAVISGKGLSVHFLGAIRWKDVFGRVWSFKFRYRWHVTGLKNLDGTPHALWQQYGTEEDNGEYEVTVDQEI